jgi:hypothetical protein
MIVDAHGADVGMAEPFLHLGDVGLMIERVGGGGRAQRMCADLEPKRGGMNPHRFVYAVCRDRQRRPAAAFVAAVALAYSSAAYLILESTHDGPSRLGNDPPLETTASDYIF